MYNKRYSGTNTDDGRRYHYSVADYEYEINGRKKKYHFIGEACPGYLPMYYYENKNEVHPENELDKRRNLWQIPFLVGIAAGVIFMFLVLVVLLLLIIVAFINHKIQLAKEEKLLSQMGKLVEVNGHKMHIYEAGEGEHTLVFMSGGGTCSPALDFKSLYSGL